jgi:hypothetical protein
MNYVLFVGNIGVGLSTLANSIRNPNSDMFETSDGAFTCIITASCKPTLFENEMVWNLPGLELETKLPILPIDHTSKIFFVILTRGGRFRKCDIEFMHKLKLDTYDLIVNFADPDVIWQKDFKTTLTECLGYFQPKRILFVEDDLNKLPSTVRNFVYSN